MSAPSTEPRMVRLLQCTRRSCQKVFPDDEAVTKPYSGWLICPHCIGRKPAPTTRIQPDGRSIFNPGIHIQFDLATLPGIPVHPKAGKRVREGIAALVKRIGGKQCCFAAAAESSVPRCTKPATRKWGGIWFCDGHGIRSMPVAPAAKQASGVRWEQHPKAGAWFGYAGTCRFIVVEARKGCFWAMNAEGDFPTLEAAQQAAVARAVELVEATLAILKP